MVGKVGKAVNTAGKITDPITAVTAPVGYAAKKAAPVAAEIAGWPGGIGGVSGMTLLAVMGAALL
jgi:hypothetical protein